MRPSAFRPPTSVVDAGEEYVRGQWTYVKPAAFHAAVILAVLVSFAELEVGFEGCWPRSLPESTMAGLEPDESMPSHVIFSRDEPFASRVSGFREQQKTIEIEPQAKKRRNQASSKFLRLVLSIVWRHHGNKRKHGDARGRHHRVSLMKKSHLNHQSPDTG